MTGASCGDPLHTYSLTSAFKQFTKEQLIMIGSALIALIVVTIVSGVWCGCRRTGRRGKSKKSNINNDPSKVVMLNSVSEHQQYKRSSKMSNLDVIQREMQQRPVSYTPSSNNEHSFVHNPVLQYNNLDTLRSYGSAGDELENVPPEYRKATNQPTVNLNSGSASDTDSLHKQKWAEQMQMQTFTDTKINNDLKRISPVSMDSALTPHRMPHIKQTGILPGRLLAAAVGTSSFEDSPSHMGAYHWDASDWLRRSHNPLPNITEVPGSEVPDSSSFHSNESNESHPKNALLPPILGPVDPARDIETLNEDLESEFVDDSECDQSEQPLSLGFDQNTSIPCLNPLDSGSEDYRFNTGELSHLALILLPKITVNNRMPFSIHAVHSNSAFSSKYT
jgi:protocadherin Fat 1/2/3